jgi:hypothetical protein
MYGAAQSAHTTMHDAQRVAQVAKDLGKVCKGMDKAMASMDMTAMMTVRDHDAYTVLYASAYTCVRACAVGSAEWSNRLDASDAISDRCSGVLLADYGRF